MSEQAGRKLRWGVLGAARINRRLLPGIKAATNAELIGIASRDQSKAEAAAQQYILTSLLWPTRAGVLARQEFSGLHPVAKGSWRF